MDERRPATRSRRPSSSSTAWPRPAASPPASINFADALHGAVDMAAEAHSRDGGLAGVSTGLIDLDHKLGGLHPSDLLILAAPPLDGEDGAGHQHRLQRRPHLRLGAAARRHRRRPSPAASSPSSRWKCRPSSWPCACWPKSRACRRPPAQGRDRRQRVRPHPRRGPRDPGSAALHRRHRRHLDRQARRPRARG